MSTQRRRCAHISPHLPIPPSLHDLCSPCAIRCVQGWVHWEEKLNASWKVPANEPFYKILVPTVDTTRYTYLLSSMMRA